MSDLRTPSLPCIALSIFDPVACPRAQGASSTCRSVLHTSGFPGGVNSSSQRAAVTPVIIFPMGHPSAAREQPSQYGSVASFPLTGGYPMPDTSQIKEHMDVISSDKKTVGKVDHLEGSDKIRLTKQSSPARRSQVITASRPGAARLLGRRRDDSRVGSLREFAPNSADE